MSAVTDMEEIILKAKIGTAMELNEGTCTLYMKDTGRELLITKSVGNNKNWTLYDGCLPVVRNASPSHICHLIATGKCYV